MTRFPAVLGALLSLLILLTAPHVAAAQSSGSVAWERFDVAVDVLPDGTLQVVQTERIRFEGTFQRAFREIPLDRVSSITEVQVGEPGQSYRPGYNQPGTYAVTRSDNNVRIDWWFPRTTNASRTFEIRYRVSGAIRVYPGGDQLYWVVVPADRPGPVEASTVVVRLPQAVPADQLQAAAYRGGRSDSGTPSVAPPEVHYSTQNLPPGQAYEVRLQFPHGLVSATAPPWQAAFDRERAYDETVRPILNLLLLLGGLAILVGGLLWLYLRWFTQGRDPAGGPRVPELDHPPSDLPPALAGTVVDERADLQDVLATLVDLGNRGVIRITHVQEGDGPDYKLELLQKQPLGLRGFERTVIGALFGGGDEALMSRVKDRWSANIPLFQSQLYQAAVERRLFIENPDEVRLRWRNGGLLLIVGAIFFGFLAQMFFGGGANLVWFPFFALVVVGLAAAIASRWMPRRTKAGAVEAAGWRAFARYLASAQKRPDGKNTQELTQYLPYAVALGVDRSWLENFEAVQAPRPRFGGGPVVIVGPGGWGYPGYYGPRGPRMGGRHHRGEPGPPGGGPGGPDEWSGGLSGGLSSASGSLADLLNAASEALSHGGGSGWGGGWSGGGGGGGGGSGGGSAGFG